MSKQEWNPALGGSPVETRLGQALAVIHRILPRLDEPGRTAEIQAALTRAVALLDSAREAYEQQTALAAPTATPAQGVETEVAPEIAAVIAAAVAVLFQQPYRLISVQQVTAPAPHLNVWAWEGRTQIFQSHKIR
jgi:hypothetical protein